MQKYKRYTGFAITIAWPETYCKQPGTWYDSITGILCFSINNYYKAGHAASVLIDSEKKKCHYFDFDRYHAPYQHGRGYSAETDHELEMKTVPVISADGMLIENINEILTELQATPACHGEGVLHATYSRIAFLPAFDKANQLQHQSPVPYGPFKYKGSKCSRFVNSTILAGNPVLKFRLRLKYFVPLTPTPLNNVNSLGHHLILTELLKNAPFILARKLDNQLLRSTLPQTERASGIPRDAQWLSGEGAGSWFAFETHATRLKVTRYSADGNIECEQYYENHNNITPESGNS